MGILLQIAIPLLVTAGVLVVIAIWRKYLKMETVVTVATLLALGIVALIMQTPDSEEAKLAGGKVTESHAVSLMLAEECLIQGEYKTAGDILQELDRLFAADTSVQLARARHAVLTGDYAAAIPRYQQAGASHAQELAAVQKLLTQSTAGNGAVIQYLKEQGLNPADYGLQDTVPEDRVDVTTVKADILEALQDKKDGYSRDWVRAAEQACQILINFRMLVEDQDVDIQDIASDTKALNGLMEDSKHLQGNPYLRQARMKGYVAQGKYKTLADTASIYTTEEELMVLTELFVSGLISRKDFAEEYTYIDKAKAAEMIELCYDVLEKNEPSITEEEHTNYWTRISQFEKRVDDPLLFALRRDLTAGAYGGPDAMRSKLFLSLAKLEYHQGNVREADGYVSDALGSSANSDDDNYRVPMSQMVAIIQGSADSEDVKNIAVYVDQALDHSIGDGMPVELLETEESSDPPQNGEEQSEEKTSFGDHMEDQVIKSTAMLNIGVINKEQFPNVQARVQIQSQKWSSLEEIKKHLLVYDCGSAITDFELEKLTFQGARIVLLCDVSGSMSGNEQALKDAIVAFSQNMVPGEKVSVIGFDDKIVFQKPFSDDPNEVASYADSISIGGGTALYQSVLDTLEMFTQDINSNDIIIAMTDGQDNNPAGKADMQNVLGALAASKGVTIYTMGLGTGVDTEYLTDLALCGNGSFLYADNTEKMNTFYDFIHGQLANQYILSYTAKNKTLNRRQLELQMKDEMGNARKTYYLQDPEYTNTDGDSYDAYIAVDSELTVYGLATKFLYKSTAAQEVMLLGTGFSDGDDVMIRLTGNVQYELEATFVDEGSYRVVIPAEIATGVYDLTAAIRGENVELEKELTVAVYGTQKTFQFGDYHFTALKSYVNDEGHTVLEGNVTMNGWLMFKGNVTVISDYDSAERVTLLDESGSTVSYKATSAIGLAKFMAEKGIPLAIPKLGRFTIYNTPYTAHAFDEFPVEKVEYLTQINAMFLQFENGSISLYPDMLRLQGLNYHYSLPFQEQLIRNFELDMSKQLDLDTDVLLGATQIAATGSVKYKDFADDEDLVLVSFPLSLKSFSAEIDTLKNDYTLEAGVGIKSLKDSTGLNMSFGIKNGHFDSIGLQISHDKLSIPLLKTPIPVSMSDFGLALSDFSKHESNNSTLSNLLGTTVTAKFKVDVASLNDYAPGISKIIDDKDVALATLDNCELSLNLKELRLAFTADVVLATVLDIGKCEIELGKFSYTNALIGYYDETQYGLRAKVTIGSKWETTNLSLLLQGSGELTLGYPYTGLWLQGDLDFDVGWWLLQTGVDVSGDLLIGAYRNSSDNFQFSIIVRGTDSGGSFRGFHLYVTKASGFQACKY